MNLLEQALAAPFQSARERYANNLIALRARQEALDGLKLDEVMATLRATAAAWRSSRAPAPAPKARSKATAPRSAMAGRRSWSAPGRIGS